MILVFGPAWEEWKGIRWRTAAFPLLGEFARSEELRLWQSQGQARIWQAVLRIGEENQPVLQVDTMPGEWSGVSYRAGDFYWRDYQVLKFGVYNSGETFLLGIRIDDHGDVSRLGLRYQEALEIKPGENQFVLPLDTIKEGPLERRLDLAAIRRVAFFTASGEKQSHRFYLHNVRLE